MAITQVDVPDIGGSEGAEVIELLVSVGDEVAVDQGLIVLESDKASMEIPSTVAGRVVELLVSEGDELVEGSPVAKIESDGEGESEVAQGRNAEREEDEDSGAGEASGAESAEAGDARRAAGSAAKREPEAPPAKEESDAPQPDRHEREAGAKGIAERRTERRGVEAGGPERETSPRPGDRSGSFYAGPAVRKLARELGAPLARVRGTGPQGRILKEDLQAFVRERLEEPAVSGGALPVVPDIDFSEFGEVELTARSRLDKLTAANMQRSWLNVPHVTQFDDADITDLEMFRDGLRDEARSRGVKLSPLPFVLKACAVALRDNPRLNSSLAEGGESLALKQYCHIGMAVDTPAGLLVPVIRDVDEKSIWEIAGEVMDLAERARERKLSPGDMQGGSFTVSSLGGIGGRGFTPIINTPEVAILGVSRAEVRPVWRDGEFQPRTLLPLSLSYDHRVVNGGHGGRFLTQLASLLGDIRRLLM